MREDIKKTLYELQERAAKDIQKLLEKGEITPTEWKSAGDAVDIIKDVECSIKDAITTSAMENEYGEDEYGTSEHGYSWKYPYVNRPNGESFAMGRRRSSYGGEMNNAIMNLRNLMNNASSENERMMYQRFIDEAEKDRYGR